MTLSSGAITAITAAGGSGFCDVKPARYRVRITGGGGSGAAAYATGSPTAWTVHVTHGGSGYVNPPVVSFSGGGGSGAAGQAVVVGGVIASINITSAGAGYASAPTISISGGGGSGATATAMVSSGHVAAIAVTAPGSGYLTPLLVDIQGAYTFGGNAAEDQQDPALPGFGLGYGIGPGGPHYNFAGKVYCEARFGDQLPGDVMASLAGYDATWAGTGSSGANAGAVAQLSSIYPATVTGVVVTNGGNGYTTTPTVTISGGGGSGATATATVRGGRVISIAVTNGGSGYTSVPSVSIDASTTIANGGPYVGGCAYIYLNIGYDSINFPAAPEIRVTVSGKNNIYDPRTGQTGYSANWALLVADVITDPVWGLNDSNVNQAQLIAAANVCDEQVMTSQGYEANYTCHVHYDTGTSPGDALSLMLPGAAGRLSYIGGQWYLWPAYWQGPSFTFDQGALIDAPEWNPYRSFKELFNRVNGTYVAPNFPYSTKVTGGIPGQLYDANGWYYGTSEDVWPFAFQPTNFPQYACDVLHGYSSDALLAQDGGVVLPKEVTFRSVISIVQAQRVAKIMLLRNRWQGSGSFPMQLAAFQMQPTDVMQFTMPAMGWASKILEVERIQFVAEPQKGVEGDEGPVALSVIASVIETDPSIYEWNGYEELSPYDVPALLAPLDVKPLAPTALTITDDAATGVVTAGGVSVNRALVSWTPPADARITLNGSIQVQYYFFDLLVAGFVDGLVWTPGPPIPWVDYGLVSGDATSIYLVNSAGLPWLLVQIRSVMANGSASAWVNSAIVVAGSPTFYGVASATVPPMARAVAVAFAPTMTFDLSEGVAQSVTLAGNVSASSAINAANSVYTFAIIQDGAGGHSFAWPSNFYGGGGISAANGTAAANTAAVQSFLYIPASNLFVATGPMTITTI